MINSMILETGEEYFFRRKYHTTVSYACIAVTAQFDMLCVFVHVWLRKCVGGFLFRLYIYYIV